MVVKQHNRVKTYTSKFFYFIDKIIFQLKGYEIECEDLLDCGQTLKVEYSKKTRR